MKFIIKETIKILPVLRQLNITKKSPEAGGWLLQAIFYPIHPIRQLKACMLV